MRLLHRFMLAVLFVLCVLSAAGYALADTPVRQAGHHELANWLASLPGWR